jgi:magnesium transporter
LLTWRYGHFLVLALIFGAAGLLFWRFRRSGWI